MDSRDIEKWRVELDSYAHVEDGVEYWLARDLMEPLGYTQWRELRRLLLRGPKSSCDTNKTASCCPFCVTPAKMVDCRCRRSRG